MVFGEKLASDGVNREGEVVSIHGQMRGEILGGGIIASISGGGDSAPQLLLEGLLSSTESRFISAVEIKVLSFKSQTRKHERYGVGKTAWMLFLNHLFCLKCLHRQRRLNIWIRKESIYLERPNNLFNQYI